jgi:N-acetylmuramoyl-L-alanine amidase
VIVIDPGHGGSDTGTTGGGLLEKDYQLEIALRLRDLLLEQYTSIEVVMTRETDTAVNPDAASLGQELQARVDIANRHLDAIFISLHHDAHSSPNPSGGTLYIYGPVSWVPAVGPDGTVNHAAPRSYALAQQALPIFTQTLSEHGIRVNGIKAGNFHVLRETRGQAVLIEAFFATNPLDAAIAKKPAFQHDLAAGYAQMLAVALDLKRRPSASPVRIILPNGQQVVGELRGNQTWYKVPTVAEWVPIRPIAESLGHHVRWIESPPTVIIS